MLTLIIVYVISLLFVGVLANGIIDGLVATGKLNQENYIVIICVAVMLTLLSFLSLAIVGIGVFFYFIYKLGRYIAGDRT